MLWIAVNHSQSTKPTLIQKTHERSWDPINPINPIWFGCRRYWFQASETDLPTHLVSSDHRHGSLGLIHSHSTQFTKTLQMLLKRRVLDFINHGRFNGLSALLHWVGGFPSRTSSAQEAPVHPEWSHRPATWGTPLRAWLRYLGDGYLSDDITYRFMASDGYSIVTQSHYMDNM